MSRQEEEALLFNLGLDPRPQLETDEQKWMWEAIREAIKAYRAKEVPVGAVVIFQKKIIARAHNQTELLKDATAHAEMLALTSAQSYIDDWRLNACSLVSTLEPCSMCLGAMFLTRTQNLIWGACDIRHGACGSWVNLLASKHPTHEICEQKDVLSIYSETLMRAFFQERRQEK